MPATLTTKAVEESTYVITAAFTDENDNPVTPNTITWSLHDRDGSVVNSRLNVSIAVPATSVDIVLSGDDLQITSANDDGRRKLTVSGTYDSALGSDLPFNDECTFTVADLVGIS